MTPADTTHLEKLKAEMDAAREKVARLKQDMANDASVIRDLEVKYDALAAAAIENEAGPDAFAACEKAQANIDKLKKQNSFR